MDPSGHERRGPAPTGRPSAELSPRQAQAKHTASGMTELFLYELEGRIATPLEAVISQVGEIPHLTIRSCPPTRSLVGVGIGCDQ